MLIPAPRKLSRRNVLYSLLKSLLPFPIPCFVQKSDNGRFSVPDKKLARAYSNWNLVRDVAS